MILPHVSGRFCAARFVPVGVHVGHYARDMCGCRIFSTALPSVPKLSGFVRFCRCPGS